MAASSPGHVPHQRDRLLRPGASGEHPRRAAPDTALLTALLATGFLGGYTTFSTYALEGVVLYNDGRRRLAAYTLLALSAWPARRGARRGRGPVGVGTWT